MGLTFCTRNSSTSSQTARSGKYLKLLKGNSTPSLDTILDIDAKARGVASLFHSPFWRAMYSLEINETAFPFECLDINVQQQIFEPERDMLGNLQRKELYKKEVNKIFEFGSLSAFSCLLLLRNQFDKNYCQISKYYLEKLIRYSYINICATAKLSSLHWDTFNQLCKWLMCNTHSEIKQAPSNAKILNALIAQKESTIRLFIRKVKTRIYDEEIILLASIISLANERFVYRELKKLNERHEIKNLMPREKKGLHWVISKLNASNERVENIQLIQTNKITEIIYPPVS